jgi:hypothetical protein
VKNIGVLKLGPTKFSLVEYPLLPEPAVVPAEAVFVPPDIVGKSKIPTILPETPKVPTELHPAPPEPLVNGIPDGVMLGAVPLDEPPEPPVCPGYADINAICDNKISEATIDVPAVADVDVPAPAVPLFIKMLYGDVVSGNAHT